VGSGELGVGASHFRKNTSVPANGIRAPVAHGGNPQDRTGLAIRDFTHLRGFQIPGVRAGGREFV
jgi:hypothetical protein